MKITITIQDDGETGATVSTEFDPPIKDDSPLTAAAALALRIIEAIPKLAKESQ